MQLTWLELESESNIPRNVIIIFSVSDGGRKGPALGRTKGGAKLPVPEAEPLSAGSVSSGCWVSLSSLDDDKRVRNWIG
jgi:hypothetical protein